MSDAFTSGYDDFPAKPPWSWRTRIKVFGAVLAVIAVIGYWGCVKPPFITLPSGLKYRILRTGTGTKPGPRDQVLVQYEGWLDDGTVFDSTYDRRMTATMFNLSAVIPAWTEGLQLVGVDGMIELEVPPELGYGKHGIMPMIPPNATLHFVIELLEVHPVPAPPDSSAESAENPALDDSKSKPIDA